MKIDHEKLQSSTGALFPTSHEGVIEQLFFPLIPDLDHELNTLNVATTALQLLREEIPCSFTNIV